ncbi:MAG: CRTAC1 family protein [Pseudonocardiales bacterium]|nr:CRTAC1 family protein [Pseudonocardiales bacterium]
MRSKVAGICAVAMMAASWQFARPPELSSAQLARLAQPFVFKQEPLNGTATPRTVRPVAPDLTGIRSWISAVGAAVALTDLQNAGRPEDACIVDPRYDTVTLEPVPGTGLRYAPIQLIPHGLPYDATTMAPMGCAPGDYNEDGKTSILVYYWGRSPVLFLRNDRSLSDGAAAFTPQELVSPYEVWDTNTVALADITGDGHTDIVVGNYFPDGAEVLDPYASRQEQMHMQRSMSNSQNGGTEHLLLFRSGHGGTHPSARYAEAPDAFPAAASHGWTLSIGAQDLTGNGLPDLYFANDFGPDWLLRNLSTPGHVRFQLERGVRHFTTPKSQALGYDSFKGMGVAFTDLTGAGVPDILVSNITEPFALEESNFAWVATRMPVLNPNGAAYYDNWSEKLGLSRSGWAWDIKAGDFDDSGYAQILQATGFVQGQVNRWPELQELAMANDAIVSNPSLWPRFTPGDALSGSSPNPFYIRGPNGRYWNIAPLIGVTDTEVSRGIALGDVFHNGHLDFAVANQWRQSYFYLNESRLQHPYLGLRLLEPVSPEGGLCVPASQATATTPAVGAEVRLLSGTQGLRIGQLYYANGHAGVSGPELEFGLTENPAAVRVEVTWRDGCGQMHTASTTLAPGWHSLLLGSNASIREVIPS